MKVQVALFKNSGPIASLIKWQTDSPYSHAALLFRGETGDILLQSNPGRGVHWTANPDLRRADIFDYVEHIHSGLAFSMYNFAKAQLGKGYDYFGVARFISRRRLPENDRWFCSELVFAAFRSVGIRLLERIEAWQVDPGMLSFSPLLVLSPFMGR